ncbi:FAS1-like dehydratase domain-containing protein [Paraburkholderia sp. J7]|uniref:FAS1-like dehydratase domain-containing protein n=1 Tax=Paraburkholderia sp. J7 TaxID=2805438 RepID=UPI002AB6FA39|nr:MaoC family dehydratase N-terminal domain-containing protein [Paraburkholderia sp. J7]
MSEVELENVYESWIGREEVHTARIEAGAVRAMAATLDLDAAPTPGEALPPGWQWLFFNPAVRRSGLGADGHPQRGGFLPPIALPRRMWAGSRIRYLQSVPVDASATRTSRILKVEKKAGKRGTLWFVTVGHVTSCDGLPCIEEEQDIVYREAAPPGGANAAAPAVYEAQAQWRRDCRADSTLLFRYSALTFNGHRIHYDETYARDEEGYPGLVVHGPLTATLLQQFAVEHGGGRRLARFDFRGVSPLFVDRAFSLEGRAAAEGGLDLWARGAQGELAMSATAVFA